MSQQQKQILTFPLVLVFVEIVTYLSTDMYLPALPILSKELHVTQSLVQYTQTSWFLGATSMQLILGPLAIKYGRKLILILGLIMFIISSFICANTNNIHWFLLARFFQGTTVCVVMVTGYATIHDIYTGKRAVQILAIMGSVTILAPALGPVLGAMVIKIGNWQSIFSLLSSCAVLGLVGVFLSMPASSINNTDNPSRGSINIYNTIIDYKNIIFNAQFIKITLINCFVIICFFFWIVESPFIIINTYEKSQVYFGFVQVLVFGGFICGGQISKRLIIKMTAKELCDRGLFIVAVSLLAFTLLSYHRFSINLIIASMTLVAVGTAMISGLLNRLAIESLTQPMEQRVSVFSTLISLSACLGSYLVIYIVNITFVSIAFLMLIFVSIALLLYLNIRNKITIST